MWRLLGVTSGGSKVISGQTHLVVHEDRLWEVWPDQTYYEGEPGPEKEYELEPASRRLAVIVPRGRFCYVVEPKGDELRMRLGGVFGTFPESIDDEHGSLYRYVRETDADLVERHNRPPPRVARHTASHPVLGDLVYDDNLHWWTAEVSFGGARIRCSLEVPGEMSRDDAFERAASLLRRLDCDALKAYAASQLLDLHNDTWLGDDEDEIDAASFAARMTPDALTVSPDGSVSAWFDDGDLFWGHSIHVRLGADLHPHDAGIEG